MNPLESANRPPEVAIQNRPESAPGRSEVSGSPENGPSGELQQSGGSQPTAPATSVNTQLPPIVPVQQPATPAVSDDTPLMAADDEVIEQEWVQKAKKIVADTKGDPYSQEKEVGKLQAEYLKKRYGKEIKLTSD